MKLSELTNEQKSRWIAERLFGWSVKQHAVPETNPNHGAPGYEGLMWYVYTPKGELISDMGYTTADAACAQYYPDFVNDPAMTVMLLERLQSPKLECWNDKSWTCMVLTGPEEWLDRTWVCARAAKFSQAVADAFMLANGFECEKP